MDGKLTHILYFPLTALLILACGLIFIDYGWISFATLTERPGLNGDWYSYYRVNRIVFGLYKLFIAAGALVIIGRLAFFIYKGNKPKLAKTFIQFAVFLVILVLCEIYLSTRFVGKG